MHSEAVLQDEVSPEAVRYVTDVTDFFLALRGSGTSLSPNDMALIQTWHAAGVPLNTVLRGLHRGSAQQLKRARPVRSLASLNRAVEQEAQATAPRRESGQTRRKSRASAQAVVNAASVRPPVTAVEVDAPPSAHALQALLETYRQALDTFATRSAGLPSIQRVFQEAQDALERAVSGPQHPLVGLLALGRSFYERLWQALPSVDQASVDAELEVLLQPSGTSETNAGETGLQRPPALSSLDAERVWELRLSVLRERFGLFAPHALVQVWEEHG